MMNLRYISQNMSYDGETVPRPHPRAYLSSEIDVHDQTILICVQEL